MYKLSLKRGIRTCSTSDNQDIFLCPTNDNKYKESVIKAIDLIPYQFWRNVPSDKVDLLRNNIIKRQPPRDASITQFYNSALDIISREEGKEIMTESIVRQLPKKSDEMEHILIAGASGAGKTHFACNWIKEYLKQNKQNEFFIISRHEEEKDKQVEKLKPYRINMSEFDDDEDEVKVEDLANSVILFDDVDNIQNKKIKDKICKLRNDVAENGRHLNIKLVSCIHVLLGGNFTKILINEASYIVVFPKSGGYSHITQLCHRYLGFDRNTIKKILNLPSRWVSISKRAPFHVIHERGIFII